MSESRPVWEPWTPAVGERVRIRISPECPGRRSALLPDWIIQHAEDESGQVGRIVEMLPPLVPLDGDSHPYGVEHTNFAGMRVVKRFAAVELEPMEATNGDDLG